jgi:hypothetical protein
MKPALGQLSHGLTIGMEQKGDRGVFWGIRFGSKVRPGLQGTKAQQCGMVTGCVMTKMRRSQVCLISLN